MLNDKDEVVGAHSYDTGISRVWGVECSDNGQGVLDNVNAKVRTFYAEFSVFFAISDY